MKEIEKWAERIYAESDFGRSIATSASGVIGLVTYLFTDDWVLAGLSLIISFPIIRIISTGLNNKFLRIKKRSIEKEDSRYIFNRLSDDEKIVVKSFVNYGGSVLTWNQMNHEDVSSTSVESLIQRELLSTSMTADGMRETFVLDSNIFDIGNEILADEETF